MSVAVWLVDAAESLRAMAHDYTDDFNDVHLLTHGAIVILLRERALQAQPTETALAAALDASAQALADSEDRASPLVSRRHLEWTSHAP